MEIQFDNYWELLALHKTLMAVKFAEESNLKEAQGSPFTASVAFKVFDEIIKHATSQGKDAEVKNWLEWQEADNDRSETQLLRKAINESSWWQDADQERKEDFIVNFMAPLKLLPEVQAEVLKQC